jgi:hypothetical protein
MFNGVSQSLTYSEPEQQVYILKHSFSSQSCVILSTHRPILDVPNFLITIAKIFPLHYEASHLLHV